eukprot:2174482-Karenia_brevis.AAC.1
MSYGKPPLPILDTPFQLLKPTMLRFAFDALHRIVSKTRTVLHDAPAVDPKIYCAATRDLDEHSHN